MYSLLLPGHATVELKKYSMDDMTPDTLWFEMKFYYTLGGSVIHKDKQLDVLGNIFVNVGFYTVPKNSVFGHLTHWDATYNLQARDIEGKLEEYSEKSSMKCKMVINEAEFSY